MKKIQRFFLMILSVSLMAGCANKPVMPPLKYDQPIGFQVAKNAYLSWEFGKEQGAAIPTNYNQSGGLIGALVVSAIDSTSRANNPSRYTLSYGKAEQAVFMTSLQDILEQNHVFKQVNLIGDSQKVASNDVLINIFFKTARVASPERGYRITLNVEMIIETGGKVSFKRAYVVQSDAEGFSPSFREQQIDVSNRLLEKIIDGIERWHTLNKGTAKGSGVKQ